MGIRSWFTKRRVRKIDRALRGLDAKALAQLQREGGWDLLGNLIATSGADPSAWKDFSTAQIEELYRIMSIVFACVKKISDTSPSIPYSIFEYDERTGDREEVPDHEGLRLLEHPNDKMSYSDFIYNVVMHLELTGVSYIQKIRNRGGYPTGLWPYPTSWVFDATDRNGNLTHYAVRSGKFKLLLPVEDVIVIRYPDPSNPQSSAGPTRAALREFQIDTARADYLIEMMENMQVPGPIITKDGSWTEKQVEATRSMFRDRVGKGKRGSPIFLGGEGAGLSYQAPLADMDWPSTASHSESRACACYEVPPIIIHLRIGIEHGTYSNYGQARRSFFEGKMLSVNKKVGDALSLGLLHAEGDEQFWFEPVTDDVPELQEDKTMKHDRARADFHGGGISLDRYREIIGEEPLPGDTGDLHVRPMNLVEFIVDGDLVEKLPPDTSPPPSEEETEPKPEEGEEAAPVGDEEDEDGEGEDEE